MDEPQRVFFRCHKSQTLFGRLFPFRHFVPYRRTHLHEHRISSRQKSKIQMLQSVFICQEGIITAAAVLSRRIQKKGISAVKCAMNMQI